jgi:hypothetical protein
MVAIDVMNLKWSLTFAVYTKSAPKLLVILQALRTPEIAPFWLIFFPSFMTASRRFPDGMQQVGIRHARAPRKQVNGQWATKNQRSNKKK